MKPHSFRQMSEVEDQHWWFVGRRAIARKLLSGLELPQQARILEIGAGTGGNLELLRSFGDVVALEHSAVARDLAARKSGMPLLPGTLPHGLPPLAGRFDLVCAFDVLEHIDDDVESLAACKPLLGANGMLLLTVPALPWLWSRHDVQLEHKRRYTLTSLEKVARTAGYTVHWSSYFSFWLLPAAIVGRLADRVLLSDTSSGSELPPKALNAALAWLFSSERYFLPRLKFPVGLSIAAVLKSR